MSCVRSAEFDLMIVTYRAEGYRVILLNSNPVGWQSTGRCFAPPAQGVVTAALVVSVTTLFCTGHHHDRSWHS